MENMNAEERIRQIERQVAEAQQAAQASAEMQRSIEQLRAVAQSPQGYVTVTVDSAGRLCDIEFQGSFARMNASQLSEEVKKAIIRAQSDAAQQVAVLARQTYGEDSALTEKILSAYSAVKSPLGSEDEPPEASSGGFVLHRK